MPNTIVSNPIQGASVYGLTAAGMTAIGAWVLNPTHIYTDTLTVLAGGAVVGAIAGTITCCLSTGASTAETPTTRPLATQCIDTALAITALLTAPLMGQAILHHSRSWSEVMLAEVVGSAITGAGACGIATLAGCYALFQRRRTPEEMTQHLLETINKDSEATKDETTFDV